MKILYAVQGTGNGHLSRAMEIIPVLQKKCDLDILVSGIQADLKLPQPVKYKMHGWSFIFGKSGGVDILATLKKTRFIELFKDIRSLPVEQYDLIINDFEPVSAWAARFKKQKCVGLSNQCAAFSPHVPHPESSDFVGKFTLKNYAPTSACYGLHFEAYEDNIFTPIIRREIRELQTSNDGHYTVYLPSYDNERIINVLGRFKNIQWEVFSKHDKTAFRVGNVSIMPIDSKSFIKSLASCAGTICGAGFGATSEALFLKKKLLVIPMKAQYEQHINAATLSKMGVPVIKSLKEKYADVIEAWLESDKIVEVNYPDITEQIIDKILKEQL
jgi:uncharacterized protein (TIGR00661 family)